MNGGLRTAEGRFAWLVVLIALHSYVVGLMLLFGGEWALSLGGWTSEHPGFFMRQGGAFHLIVATVYLFEWFRHRSVFALLLAKAIAVLFLGAMALRGEPWMVAASGVIDGAMLAMVWWLRPRP